MKLKSILLIFISCFIINSYSFLNENYFSTDGLIYLAIKHNELISGKTMNEQMRKALSKFLSIMTRDNIIDYIQHNKKKNPLGAK